MFLNLDGSGQVELARGDRVVVTVSRRNPTPRVVGDRSQCQRLEQWGCAVSRMVPVCNETCPRRCANMHCRRWQSTVRRRIGSILSTTSCTGTAGSLRRRFQTRTCEAFGIVCAPLLVRCGSESVDRSCKALNVRDYDVYSSLSLYDSGKIVSAHACRDGHWELPLVCNNAPHSCTGEGVKD